MHKIIIIDLSLVNTYENKNVFRTYDRKPVLPRFLFLYFWRVSPHTKEASKTLISYSGHQHIFNI